MNEEVQALERPQDPSTQVKSEFTIKVMGNGGVAIQYPEGQPELPNEQLEGIAKYIYENLRDQRIAEKALKLFKQRLG